MAVLPKVRSALCAASQLPVECPLMWKMLLHLNQNPMMMMIKKKAIRQNSNQPVLTAEETILVNKSDFIACKQGADQYA